MCEGVLILAESNPSTLGVHRRQRSGTVIGIMRTELVGRTQSDMAVGESSDYNTQAWIARLSGEENGEIRGGGEGEGEGSSGEGEGSWSEGMEP